MAIYNVEKLVGAEVGEELSFLEEVIFKVEAHRDN